MNFLIVIGLEVGELLNEGGASPVIRFVWSFAGCAFGFCCSAVLMAMPFTGAIPTGGYLLLAAEAFVTILLAVVAAERDYSVFIFPGPGRFAVDIDRPLLDDPIHVTFFGQVDDR